MKQKPGIRFRRDRQSVWQARNARGLESGRCLRWLFRPVIAIFVSLLAANLSLAKESYAIKPPPPWVQPVAAFQNEESMSQEAGNGIVYLLADEQCRVTQGMIERYYHQIKKVTSTVGLEDVSQLQLDFEPSYESLIIHYIRIIRGGSTIDALNPEEIKIIQQENELRQQLYNGTLSALIILNDIRAGDIIDYAYSVNGGNPVLDGRFADSSYLAYIVPTERIRLRLLWPSGRALQIRNRNTDLRPSIRATGSETEYIWERSGVPAFEYDVATPSWFDSVPIIELSEFSDWQDVVDWALPLYKLNGALSEGVLKQIEQWRVEFDNPEQRLLAALRFVQDEVRYMGIELGPYSHQPTQPSQVYKRRFGDCKDKSLLLTTLLNGLGIEAYPALVNTENNRALDECLPSPYAFNHVIVKATVDGKSYWFDPTMSLQRGSLSGFYNPDYNRALVVQKGNASLEQIPLTASDSPTTVVKEVYTVTAYDEPVSFQVTTTYSRMDADAMRYSLAQQSLAELGKDYLSYYAENDSSIQANGLPEVSDDPAANIIVITEKYTIPEFWKDKTRQFFPGRIYEEIRKPPASQRSTPLALSYPVYVSHSTEVHLPDAWPFSAKSDTIASDNVRLTYRIFSMGTTIVLNYEFQTLRDSVPVEQIAKHVQTLEKMEEALGYEITPGQGQRADHNGAVVILLAGLLFGPFIIFGMVKGVRWKLAQRRHNEFKQRFHQTPGDSPGEAIRLGREEDFGSHLETLRCRCGESLYRQGTALQQESGIFDGQRFIVVALRCEACTNNRDVYFVRA